MIENEKIDGSQLFMLIVLTVVGVGIFSLPRAAAEAADSDGWIAVILGGFIALLNYYIIYKLIKRFREDTLVEISYKVLGKYITLPFLAILWFYMVAIIAMTLRIFGEVVKMTLLVKTPVEVIIMSLLILSLYLARGGVEPITRFAEAVFPVIAISLVLIYLLSTTGSDFTNILPVLRSKPAGLLKGAYQTTYSYGGYEFVLLIVPFIKKPDKVFKSGLAAITVVGILYVLTVMLAFAKFGVSDVKKLIWPTLAVIRATDISGFFIERLEGIVMALWVLLAFTTISPFTYGLSLVSSRVLNHRDFRHFCSLVTPVIYIIALLPDNIVDSYKYLDMVTTYIGTVSVFIFPILLLTVAYIRKKGSIKNA